MKTPHPTPIVRIEPRDRPDGLPLEARRHLWRQIWNRLLAPPLEPVPPSDTPNETAEQVADHAA